MKQGFRLTDINSTEMFYEVFKLPRLPQHRNLGKLFTIFLVVVVIFSLSYYFFSRTVEGNSDFPFFFKLCTGSTHGSSGTVEIIVIFTPLIQGFAKI